MKFYSTVKMNRLIYSFNWISGCELKILNPDVVEYVFCYCVCSGKR